MRANFELNYGTSKTLFSVCYWASEILDEENIKFFEMFSLKNNTS